MQKSSRSTINIVTLILIPCMFLLSTCEPQGERSDKPTLTIGSDIPYKPFEYKTTSQDKHLNARAGELVGFDVEIARAIFEDQLGYQVRFTPASFDGIIPALNNGNFRVAMSAMTITDKRARKVDFSDPYFTAYQTVVVLEDSTIQSLEDLEGATVGVQKGTTGAAAAQQLQKERFNGKLHIKKYDLGPDTFQALLNNQVQAIVNDNQVNKKFILNNENPVRFLKGDGSASKHSENAPPYLTLTTEQYGIAFRKSDDSLRKQVNKAIQTIKKNGTYKKIYQRYFDPSHER